MTRQTSTAVRGLHLRVVLTLACAIAAIAFLVGCGQSENEWSRHQELRQLTLEDVLVVRDGSLFRVSGRVRNRNPRAVTHIQVSYFLTDSGGTLLGAGWIYVCRDDAIPLGDTRAFSFVIGVPPSLSAVKCELLPG